MKTNEDVEKQVAEKLFGPLAQLDLIPHGYYCEVRLHSKVRAKRRNAPFEKNWHPDTDSIDIRFVPVAEQPEPGAAASAIVDADQSSQTATDQISDLVRALDHAESRPGYKFVALKWFRDTVLPAEGFAWASEYSARDTTLRDAIERRMILKNAEPNPKNPQFPVTSIRLNRLMPEVKAILGEVGNRMPDFEPMPIRGKNLSQTILNERR